jgi:conjugative transposon TraN protein
VITEDGKLYSFIVDYINSPRSINISFVADSANAKESESLKPLYDKAAMQIDAEIILKVKKKIHRVRDHRFEVAFALQGIYIKNDVIFFKIEITNNSNINYDVEMLRFYITDEKKSKRTATQQIEIKPLYINGNTSTVKAESSNLLVVALPKFTIPDRKYLSVQLMENNGGRNLKLTVRNRTIIKAEKF